MCANVAIANDDQQLSELNFDGAVAPFRYRLHRTALILTKSPGEAEALTDATLDYARNHPEECDAYTHLGAWLSDILIRTYLARR